MEILNLILMACVAGFFIWRLYIFIKAKPESLSAESLNKSFYSMGILALGLVVFIGIIVMLLKS